MRLPEGAGGPADPKPDLVLVHGLGSDHRYWENILAELGADFGVTTVDLPGHGPRAVRPTLAQAHPRELAAAVMDQLRDEGIERPHVVGLSLGGWVVLEMAALGYRASVTALAPAGLWAPGAHIRREREAGGVPPGVAALGPGRSPDPLRPGAGIGLRINVVHPERVTTEQFLAAARALEQAKGYVVCDRASVQHRFEDGRRITVPATVAFGDHDRVLPPESSQDRRGLPDHVAWEIVTDCGHAMTWDQPEACLRLIRRTAAAA